jgi:hypothetical protein
MVWDIYNYTLVTRTWTQSLAYQIQHEEPYSPHSRFLSLADSSLLFLSTSSLAACSLCSRSTLSCSFVTALLRALRSLALVASAALLLLRPSFSETHREHNTVPLFSTSFSTIWSLVPLCSQNTICQLLSSSSYGLALHILHRGQRSRTL